ncbi:MAG: hypothetical protein Q8P41_21310 [Pseudomonadota bacterium]|nr:hypothetical protein [Pseudomonadota bacterium]
MMLALLAGVAAAATTPPVAHVLSDPLLPQKYRSVPPGVYPCSVVIDVNAAGKATDVKPVECDEEAFWALATAIVTWEFDPATDNGVPVAGQLPYTSEFEVRSLLPRKHIVGFAGLAVSAGGSGWYGAEGRIHLGEQLSVSAGVDMDLDTLEGTLQDLWVPTFRGDVTLSTPRRHHEHRGIYGFTIGGFADGFGAVGGYAGFRGELMTGVPGLSVGGDAGVAVLFTNPPTYDDVGFWPRYGTSPAFPWLRASLIWYAPIPRDRFVVIPRAQDPTVFVPEPPVEVPIEDVDGQAFAGVRAVHWSEIEPSLGDTTPTGPGFDLYPPGTYTCNVRVAVGTDGRAAKIRVEKCPQAGRADAEATVRNWVWDDHPDGEVQAVFPAPIFVRRDDAEAVRTQSVLLLVAGQAQPLPQFGGTPTVYVKRLVPPEWTMERPTRACFVDVDLDAKGTLLASKWVLGDIEVMPRVMEALAQWSFFPVAVDGELTPVRVRLSMCD